MALRRASGASRSPSAFISRATRDGVEHAARLDRALRQHNVRTWLCDRDMHRWLDFTWELEAAIVDHDVVIVCVTPDVLRQNSYVRREIAYAEWHGKPIAVARFADIAPPISVVNHTYFEFFSDWDTAFDRLLDFCQNMPAGA